MIDNENNNVKWRWFIGHKNVEQINDYLFICNYKSSEIKVGMDEMRVDDSEMSMRRNNEEIK